MYLQKCTEIKPPPSHFKSKVWTHFGFFALTGKAELDMSKTICKLSETQQTTWQDTIPR